MPAPSLAFFFDCAARKMVLGRRYKEELLGAIARLGEGVLNGLLTARIGLSAMAVCRPMPYQAEKAPNLRKVVPFLFRGEDKG